MNFAALLAAAALACLGAAHTAHAQGGEVDPNSASAQIESMASVFVRAVRRELDPGLKSHPTLARLRLLRDPDLLPLFGAIAGNRSGDIAAQGLLGLAELSEAGTIDIALLAHMPDKSARAAVAVRALSDKLVSDQQADRMLEWPDLDPELEAVLLLRAAGAGRPIDDDRARRLSTDKLPVAATLSSLLLPDADGAALADAFFDDATDAGDAGVLVPIAVSMLNEARAKQGAAFLARLYERLENLPDPRHGVLEALMRIDPQTGWALWRDQWAGAQGLGAQLRLALLALVLAREAPAGSFDAMTSSNEPIVAAIARAGRDVNSAAGADSMINLINTAYPAAMYWAVREADPLDDAQAARVWLAVLDVSLAKSDADAGAFANSIRLAARRLAERAPDQLAAWITRALAASRPELIQTALDGVLGSSEPVVLWPQGSEPAWPDRMSRALAAMIIARARRDSPDDDEQLTERISQIALGGDLPAPIRAEAAWLALKRQGQAQVGLTQLLHVIRAEGGSPAAP